MVKEIVSFDIVVKIKKTISVSKELVKELDDYLKSINEPNRSAFLFKQLVIWLKASDPSINNFEDLLEDADLKQHDFMYRLMEVIERRGLDIPRSKFSEKFSERIKKVIKNGKTP
jgi:hypothetical protein